MVIRWIVLLVFWGVAAAVPAQIVINEVVSRNVCGIVDEDGDHEDWIELYNQSRRAINLSDWYLSDEESNHQKWAFPDLVLPAKSHLVVFASGKDRRIPIQHYEQLIDTADSWHYRGNNTTPPADWIQPDFDDSQWDIGPGGFGYGDDDDNTLLGDTVMAVYIRKRFNLSDTTRIREMLLHLDFDDGFVAYLNGWEIFRVNMQKDGKIPHHMQPSLKTHEARMYQGENPELFSLAKTQMAPLLRLGENILAIQVHSRWRDGDLSAIPFLSIGVSDVNQNFRPVPQWFFHGPDGLHTNFSLAGGGEELILTKGTFIKDRLLIPALGMDEAYGRMEDGADEQVYFAQPTPNRANKESLAVYAKVEELPLFSMEAGYYPDTLWVKLTSPDQHASIHYTIDGSVPGPDALVYQDSIRIDTNTVLRARLFDPSRLPGETVTATYLIGEEAVLPVFSVSTNPDNLWDEETGIYVMGPHAQGSWPYFGANFWENWEKLAHVEFFDASGQRFVSQDAGIRINGGWTRGLRQKSLRLVARKSYSKSDFTYPFFSDHEGSDFSRLLLRNSGNDFYKTFMRDALGQQLAKQAGVLDVQDCTPVELFLNGVYWGLHNLREKFGKHYIQEHYGLPKEQVHLLEKNGLIQQGENRDFLDLIDFIDQHDLSDSAHFAHVAEALDLDSFTDLMITNLLFVNTDWPHNNVKMWKPRSGGKWRYFLVDLDASMGLMSSNHVTENYLHATLLRTEVCHVRFLKGLLQNTQYHNRFINRFADLMNSTYKEGNMTFTMERLRDAMKPVFARHGERWGLSAGNWENIYVNTQLRSFLNNRNRYVRQHIMSEFSLPRQDTIVCQVDDGQSGTIRLNSLHLTNASWSGIYFDSVPIHLEAIPNPGFTFSHWSSTDSLVMGNKARVITYNPFKTDTLVAHFSGAADTLQLKITELNYKSFPEADAGDWIELYNHDETSIQLKGWTVRDDNFEQAYTFAEEVVLSPGAFLILAADTGAFRRYYPLVDQVVGPMPFGLNQDGERLIIENPYGHPLHELEYSTSAPWPEGAHGTGRTLDLKAVDLPIQEPASWTDGCYGGSPGKPWGPCPADLQVLLTEICYRPLDTLDSGDWIELYNPGSEKIDLGYWSFLDGNDNHRYQFPAATLLDSGQYLVLVQDSLEFYSVYPELQNTVLGDFEFGLSGSGESLRLMDRYRQLHWQVDYQPGWPWPEFTSGTGRTLELRHYDQALENPSSWRRGCFLGTPGGPYNSCDTTALPGLTTSLSLFQCYPQPAMEELVVVICLKTPERVRMQVVNAQGAIVWNREMGYYPTGTQTFRLETAHWPSGIYYLQVYTGELYGFKKILIL